MKSVKKTTILLVFLFVGTLYCTNAYVVNSNTQTLSEINLETNSVNNSFAELGQYSSTAPNKSAITDEFIYTVITYENSVQKISLDGSLIRDYIFLEDSASPNDIMIVNNFAYVTGNTTYKVYKIDLSIDEVVAEIVVGKSPQSMTYKSGFLFVCNTGFDLSTYEYDSGTVSVINLEDFSIESTIDVDLNPQGITIANNDIHVACTGNYGDISGKIDIISLSSLEVINVIDIGGTPGSIDASNNGKVFVANSWPAGIYVYDEITLEIEVTPEDEIFAGGNCVNAFESYLAIVDAADYVSNSIVYFYQLSDFSLIQQFEVGVGATDIKFSNEYVSNTDTNSSPIVSKINVYPNPSKSSFNFDYQSTNSRIKIIASKTLTLIK